MKKTLSLLALIGLIGITGNQAANAAFSWSNLNPFNWGNRCNKCEQPKNNCCPQKVYRDCPCTTGAAAPCNPNGNPCQQKKTCDPCDRLQQEQMGR